MDMRDKHGHGVGVAACGSAICETNPLSFSVCQCRQDQLPIALVVLGLLRRCLSSLRTPFVQLVINDIGLDAGRTRSAPSDAKARFHSVRAARTSHCRNWRAVGSNALDLL